ncbi:unnamed protein product [Sphagnum jensenii]|uniref:Uncharacterized protein n=1 Tax=Sphagnum jensenii TaxID=128206 RepID=A0ABP0X4K6_9BRYO
MASTQAPNREAASAGRIGASSSEGSESEERAYKFGRQEILQTAERVFGDASEEYSQLGNVKFMLLFDYGMQVNGKKVEEGDADINLIRELMEKVALPVLHHEIAHCWDALSMEQSKHAIAAFQEMLIYVDVCLLQLVHAWLKQSWQ